MTKRKSPKTVPGGSPVKPSVLHGDVFRSFLDEARSIGNECAERRVFDAHVVEFLTEKGLMDEWAAWREKKLSARG